MYKIINDIIFQTFTSKPDVLFKCLNQVHGNRLIQPDDHNITADGLYVANKSLLKQPLCILTADCMPILIQGKKGIVFLHAGWRGLAAGILLQPEIKKIIPECVFIGPCIHACCYEVSEDFFKHFPDQNLSIPMGKKYFFDLIAVAQNQLTNLFPDIILEDSQICTCCNQLYNSYRRDKTSNRNYNIISIS